MIKSVFARYVLAFTLIILLSFSVIIATITSIISNYSQDAKERIMETVANSTCIYVVEKMEEQGESDIARVSLRYGEEIEAVFKLISSSSEDLTLVLTDTRGKILMAAGAEKNEISTGRVLHPSFLERVNDGKNIFRMDAAQGAFESAHLVYGLPLESDDGTFLGTVFICSSSVIMTDLIAEITKAVVLAILWIMLAAMIAVYFITERIVGPLKKISVAARQFANGKFDTRVNVGGSDEVAELAVAFNNMAESLDNYDTMRNTFISNVSHDLRTPMTSIAGFVDGILDGVIPPEKQEYYLRQVSSEVKRLSRLVASLLDLSRIQAGERKFTMSPFDVCEMARQIVISFEKQIDEKRLEVEFDCDEDNMIAVADRDAIYQIVYNLCDNAMKFSADGGRFALRIKRLKSRSLLVSVFNEGQGIAPEDLPYVFERFYKSDKSRGLNKTGVGLGLYIAKTIINAHGEEIWVESEHMKNCCFSFTLKAE